MDEYAAEPTGQSFAAGSCMADADGPEALWTDQSHGLRHSASEGCGVGESGAWGEVTAGLRVSRPVLVARLLELDAAGALTTAHVRAGAQVGGVNARTEGRVERRPRARLELSDQAWEVLAQAGGNVSVLHRHLKDAGGEVPSLASLYRVVRRDLEAGRVLPDRVVVRREREEQRTRQALVDLALAGPCEGGAAKAAVRRLKFPPDLGQRVLTLRG